MRSLLVPAAFLCVAGTAAAAPAPETSWGKAGVSLADYRHDATLCLRLAERVDLVGTQPAEALIRGTRRIDTLYGNGGGDDNPDNMVRLGQQAMNVVEFTRPQHRINQIRALMRVALDACLTELGYTRFRLTGAQRDALRRLRYGRPERHAFMHRLASDPAILAAQAVPADAE
ncbi:MAG TPA: hypothetical protein VMG08_19140 [Allosphingosinicella sp.]|nr:hypothetical protein [Allosphingosinicella sp.]